MSSKLTAGEFAKLSGTTKRTIHFYDEVGVLKPARINTKGYRFYDENQILDYQMIFLLTNFGFGLKEIKKFLRSRGGMASLFKSKSEAIKQQISYLQFVLKNLDKHLYNTQRNGTMVSPTIKTMKPFAIFYIEKTGPYAKIKSYCKELESYFSKKGENFTTLAIFESQVYKPEKSSMIIGALKKNGMKVKKEYEEKVKTLTFAPKKVITYTHNGEGKLLSLFWKELEKYCRLKNIKPRANESDFEIYRKVNKDPSKQFFEIYIPIL